MATQNASVADRIRLSYRAADAESGGDDGLDDDDLVHDRIQEPHFRAYLRRVHGGEVAVGDEWTEFVNCGCGSTTDVVVRVEALDGGTTLTEDTEVTLVRAGADAAD
jgi:hypothetical protein